MHRLDRADFSAPQLEILLLARDALAHLLQNSVALAPQALEFGVLLGQTTLARLKHAPHFGAQRANVLRNRAVQRRSVPTDHALGQSGFQGQQTASLKQVRIATDFGDQTLLCGHGQNVLRINTQSLCGAKLLHFDLGLYLLRAAEFVPQSVDFVEHHQLGAALVGVGPDVFLPNGKVRAGHASVGADDEHDRVGLVDEADGEFGLCTDGIEPGRVQNDQALFQKRVRKIDQRVAPFGHLHQALGVGGRVVLGRLAVPKAQGLRFLLRDLQGLGHPLKGVGELLGVVDVQIKGGPGLGRLAPVAQCLRLQAGLDGQEAQAGGQVWLVANFRGAHGGAPGTGGHDAPPVVGKEDGVDHF